LFPILTVGNPTGACASSESHDACCVVGSPRRSGMFITFEGPEGGGKTLQIANLAEFLQIEGYQVLTTREPGGTLIGDQIRAVLSDLTNTAMQPRTEVLLFQASRAQLVEQVILPHLGFGGIVLSDRYADSTLAYQGYGHARFTLQELRLLIAFATGGLAPDLTLLLDVDVELGLKRKVKGGEWNRLDAYDLEFHRRVRLGYLELARLEPQRWELVDANRSPSDVQLAIRQIVIGKLSQNKRYTPGN
jgi:dTMP kinase